MANFPSLQAVVESFDLYADYSGDDTVTRESFAADTPAARALRLWDDWSSFPGHEEEDVEYVVTVISSP
jgi:hypothetical protein